MKTVAGNMLKVLLLVLCTHLGAVSAACEDGEIPGRCPVSLCDDILSTGTCESGNYCCSYQSFLGLDYSSSSTDCYETCDPIGGGGSASSPIIW